MTEAPAFPIRRFFGMYSGAAGSAAEAAEASGAVRIHEIRREDRSLILNMGGIYSYNTLRWQDPGVGALEIQAFNGTRYERVYSSPWNGTVRFPKVTGPYQLKLTVISSKPSPDTLPKVGLLAENKEIVRNVQ